MIHLRGFMRASSIRWVRYLWQLLIAAVHVGIITLAWFSSFAFRFDFVIDEPYIEEMIASLPIIIVVKMCVFYVFGLFHGWWKYTSVSDLISIINAAAVSSVLGLMTIARINGLIGFPRSVMILDLLLTVLFVGGSRFAVRVFAETFRSSAAKPQRKRVLVVGAGRTGGALVREMRMNHALPYEPVGFVDDDARKQGMKLHGLPVRGTTANIAQLVHKLEVDEVLLAIPSAPGRDIRRVIEVCHASGAQFKTLPSMGDLIDGRISVNRIREVRIEDLLGREETKPDLERVRANIEGHVVLVTGAAGSIGSELARQVAMLAPTHLVLFERSESDLHDLELILRHSLPNVQLTAIVGDILDPADLAAAFEQYRPSRVFHAAAYKHVSLMERHLLPAVRHNVIGTYNVANVAQRFGADQLVLVSTDKAVRPTSLMGATKRAAERLLLSLDGGPTRFTAVRFGNVLGSRGSVVTIFKRQIEMGGPVTVTHPDVVRFFMTIPEAVQLVLQASVTSHGGDIFHLDMGEPVRIADLAANMIRLSGFEPGRDIEIKFVGLRSGEKLYEELLIDGEEVAPTEHARVRVVRAVDTALDKNWIGAIITAVDNRDSAAALALIRQAVPEYVPSDLARRHEPIPTGTVAALSPGPQSAGI